MTGTWTVTVTVEKKISGWIAEILHRRDLCNLVIARKLKDREEVNMTLSALPCILCAMVPFTNRRKGSVVYNNGTMGENKNI